MMVYNIHLSLNLWKSKDQGELIYLIHRIFQEGGEGNKGETKRGKKKQFKMTGPPFLGMMTTPLVL
jgi:hypothetical protein